MADEVLPNTAENLAYAKAQPDSDVWIDGNRIVVSTKSPAKSRTYTALEFIRLFTDDELAAIAAASSSNPSINVLVIKLAAAQEVFPDDLELVAGMQALVSAGLITQQRYDEIMAQ